MRLFDKLKEILHTIATWFLTLNKDFARLVREANAKADHEAIESAKKEIAEEGLEGVLTRDEQDRIANLMVRRKMSINEAILSVCNKRLEELGLDPLDEETEKRIKDGEISPRKAIAYVAELAEEKRDDAEDLEIFPDEKDKEDLLKILGEDGMAKAMNQIATQFDHFKETHEDIDIETDEQWDELAYNDITEIFKENFMEKLRNEGYGRILAEKVYNESINKELSAPKASIEAYKAVIENLEKTRDQRMTGERFTEIGITQKDVIKMFGKDGFMRMSADIMDGKAPVECLAAEMSYRLNNVGIEVDDTILKDRLSNDLITNKENFKEVIAEISKDQAKGVNFIMVEEKKVGTIKELLEDDIENQEFDEEHQANLFSRIMDKVKEQETPENSPQPINEPINEPVGEPEELTELTLKRKDFEDTLIGIEEYNKEAFEKYPDIKSPSGETITRDDLNRFRAALGNKIWQDNQALKDHNEELIKERGITKESLKYDRMLHTDIKSVVEAMDNQKVSTTKEMFARYESIDDYVPDLLSEMSPEAKAAEGAVANARSHISAARGAALRGTATGKADIQANISDGRIMANDTDLSDSTAEERAVYENGDIHDAKDIIRESKMMDDFLNAVASGAESLDATITTDWDDIRRDMEDYEAAMAQEAEEYEATVDDGDLTI